MARVIPLHSLPTFSIINPPDPAFNFKDGAAFLINKPKGWSSYQVVTRLRKFIDLRKVGHAGTLDPMATGLLILCCGRGTRTISAIQELKKMYRAEITFGAATYSYDAETEVSTRAPFDHITEESFREVLNRRFLGKIKQVPPMYSALKHNGKPLYEYAREEKEIEREPRNVQIYGTRILSFKLPKVNLIIRSSKGTYIRSVAHDLGQKLNSAAHLTGLRRLGIGHFKSKDALTIKDLQLIFEQ